MKRKIRIVVPLGLAAAVALVAALAATSSSAGCAQDVVAGVAGSGSFLSEGRDPVAVVGSTLVAVTEDGERTAYVHGESLTGVLRHVTARPGSGVAYVEDRPGPDAITMIAPKGVTTFVPGGEITHPAWSADGDLAYAVDLERLEVRSPGAPVRSVDRPPGTVGVFSPVFTGPRLLIAVVQEDVPGVVTHDDSLNNLWRHDLDAGTWTRLTSFTADEDTWSALRTPVLEQDERVLVVRERGRAMGTEEPSYELWAVDDSSVEKVRDLDGEAFLAAVTGDGLLWNAFADGEWRLFLDGPGGTRPMGCGGVMVDPRTATDPDHAGDEEEVGRIAPPEEVVPVDAEMGLVVGDFATLPEAQDVATVLTLVGGRVVDHAEAPGAVMPGVFAVAVPLDEAVDLDAALHEFRSRYPEYAQRSWLASLAG